MSDTPVFEGFEVANTTPVPDILFDRMLSVLSGAELKVLLYIIRRTHGFKKDTDAISLRQFAKGIKTREGRVLDEGCGISNRTVISRALQRLEKLGCICRKHGKDALGDDAPTIYTIKFRDMGVVSKTYYPGIESVPPVVSDVYYGSAQIVPRVVSKTYPQETVIQQTDSQETVIQDITSNISGIPSLVASATTRTNFNPAEYQSLPIPVTYQEALAYLQPHGPHEELDVVEVLILARKLWVEEHPQGKADDGHLADIQQTSTPVSLSVTDEVPPISTPLTAETVPASEMEQQTPIHLHLLPQDAEKPTDVTAIKASQASGKRKAAKPVEIPIGSLTEPDMTGTWNDELVVEYAEWCNGRRYSLTSKMRVSQLKAAAKLHKEDSNLTMADYKRSHDTRYDDWWKEHKRVLHVSDMAAKDNTGIVRVYAMLDKIETDGMVQIQRATLSALAQPSTKQSGLQPVYSLFNDPNMTDEEKARQFESEFYHQDEWNESLRRRKVVQ